MRRREFIAALGESATAGSGSLPLGPAWFVAWRTRAPTIASRDQQQIGAFRRHLNTTICYANQQKLVSTCDLAHT
jgi:hypothetical protein